MRRPGAFLFLFFWLVPLLHAQPQDVHFERLSVKDGLSHHKVKELFQDSQGFMWFGTEDGLNRYDGYGFVIFKHDPNNASSLSDNWIHAIYEAPSEPGVLWIGTHRGGLNRIDGATGHFRRYLHDPNDPTSLSHSAVRSIYEDREGVLWIGTGERLVGRAESGGLNQLDRATGTFTRYLHDPNDPSSLSNGNIHTIYEDQEGVLWIGTSAGLNRFNREAQTFTSFLPDSAQPTEFLSIHEDQNGLLWMGTGDGLSRFDRKTQTFSRFLPDAAETRGRFSNYILSIHEDRHGIIWAGSAFGLHRFAPGAENFRPVTNDRDRSSALNSLLVNTIRESREGVLWVGTDDGVYRSNPEASLFTHYRHEPDQSNSLNHSYVSAIEEDGSGILWIGTQAGLNRVDRRSDIITHFMVDPTDHPVKTENSVMAIHEDYQGVLWVGTGDGLYLLDLAKGAFIPVLPSRNFRLPDVAGTNYAITSIYESTAAPGVLWLATESDGLCRLDTEADAIRCYVPQSEKDTSLSSRNVTCIYEDRAGIFWIGTRGGGLNRFDPGTGHFKHYVHDAEDPRSLSGDDVLSITEDRSGRLWIGTRDGGINRFNRDTEEFTAFTEQNSALPNNTIHGLLEDEGGNLWMSTNHGLSRFDPNTEQFWNYDTDHGLQSDQFVTGAYDKGKGGELFFGGVNGFNTFFPERTKIVNEDPPQIVLTGFNLSNQSPALRSDALLQRNLLTTEPIVLSHKENGPFSFEYAALHYSNPSKNRYQYMLEGLDDDWVDAATQRQARYPKLAAGIYRFRVKGSNSAGVWNGEDASVLLIVKPPWWQTRWAYTFYLFAVVSILYGSYKWRVRNLSHRALQLRQMVHERTEDLLAEKKKTEEQAEKLRELEQVKDRFFANISHEFRTPLTLILGPIHDALDGAYGSVSPKLRSQLEVMYRQGDRLHRLINQLLDLSKLEIGRMQLRARKSDLISFAKGIVMSFASLAELRHITLQCHADADRLPIYFDVDKMEKVITNLLSNALKFTPEHGKIWVSIYEVDRTENAADAAFKTEDQPDGSFVEIQVKDTGRGIPAGELPYIFDRFYQVDTSPTRGHEGTGIGLALTKELVELHGGTIRVESQEGFGTTFFVRLPRGKDYIDVDDLAEEEVPARAYFISGGDAAPAYTVAEIASAPGATEHEAGDEYGPPDESAPTILIVEDNPDVRAYLKSHLFATYHVIEASDGEEGLAKAREIDPDLVISDLMMPKMDGIALCRALKEDEQLNHIPVILLTAKATGESKIEGLTTGADDYIYKPFNAEELLVRVENLIEVRQILRQRFSRELRVGPSEIAVPSAEAQFLEQAREVVEAHLADSHFSADWFAEEVGMSRRNLHRKLKESANLSPAGYIRMMRLERAAQLLEQHAGSVSEVAYRVGFKNADHFSRLFQQVFGVPPSKYPTE